jgi:hypothetical protein
MADADPDIHHNPTSAPSGSSQPSPVPQTSSSSKPPVSMSLHPPVQFQLHHSESQPVLTPRSEVPPRLSQSDERARWLGTASARTSFTRVDQTRAPTPSEDDSAPNTGNAAGSVTEVIAADGTQPVVENTDAEGGEGTEQEGVREDAVPQTPQTVLTFLLVSGRRRTMSFEPETTVGRVKELVWNTWPSGKRVCSPPPTKGLPTS